MIIWIVVVSIWEKVFYKNLFTKVIKIQTLEIIFHIPAFNNDPYGMFVDLQNAWIF